MRDRRIHPQEQMQHAVEQRDVGPRLDREVQVGRRGGRRRAWIDDDDPDRRVVRLRGLDAAVENRMRPCRVRSRDEKAPCVIDIVVARRGASAPSVALYPATALDMHSREFVSTLLVRSSPWRAC
jgi:hypothetical protein